MNVKRFIPAPPAFPAGSTSIVPGRCADPGLLQDFSVVRLEAGERMDSRDSRERVWLLVAGRVRFRWEGGDAQATRGSLFDENPSVLHADAGAYVTIEAETEAEITIHATGNSNRFPTRFILPGECRSELRGQGTVGETATRIVRTILDDDTAPHSNFVLGEVVTLPGRWSSFPPHYHRQPEIYHYRFLPSNGFGFAAAGDEAHVVRSGDTLLIRDGETHPQAAAPGYAMWYLWIIRHLEGDRYRTPVFALEHAWTMQKDASPWAPEQMRNGRMK